jgi:hypothetical protein
VTFPDWARALDSKLEVPAIGGYDAYSCAIVFICPPGPCGPCDDPDEAAPVRVGPLAVFIAPWRG